MGFFFDEFERDKKQHINLSESAWYIVEQDIKNFYLDEKSQSLSGFLNKILSNFYEYADASVNIRYREKMEELQKELSNKELKSVDLKTKNELIKHLGNCYKKKLIDKALSYQRGHGEKFRINVNNVELLKYDINEDDIYDGSIGIYLKALYEEYCLLPTFQREQIFFKEIVNEIEKSISKQKKVKIEIKPKHNPKDNNIYTRKFYVTPYKITQDATKSYNYLIGIAEEILNDGRIESKKISSFRISRISKIKICNSMGGYLSEDKKNEMDNELYSKNAQFLAGELINVKIKFTIKGYEQYNRLLYLRPNSYTKVPNQDLTYIFHCTELQAINYFFKFGRDVEILEPLELREKFIKRYKSALKIYEI